MLKMNVPLNSQAFPEDPQFLKLRLQHYAIEVSNLKQQIQVRDEKLRQYEREILRLRAENENMIFELSRHDKALNSKKLANYSKTTNNLFDKLTNNPTNSSNPFESQNHSSNELSGLENPQSKPKKIYNGLHFKKTSNTNKPEDLWKCIENKPRKGSGNRTSEDQELVVNPDLFENFLVISASRDSFENAVTQNYSKTSNHELRMAPSTVYSYPEMPNSCNIKKTLENYSFPFGVRSRRLILDESFSQLNEIVFAANNLIDQRTNCFSFVIKTEDSYNKACPHHNQSLYNGIRNFVSNSNKDSSDAFVKLNGLELLETANSNSFLYAFGIKTLDFIESQENKSLLPKKKRFWSIEKVYVFVSRFPFSRFFLEIILQILNLMKVSKMKLQFEQNSESFAKIDTDFLWKFFLNDLRKILDMILTVPKPLTYETLINLKDPKLPFDLSYQLPNFSLSFYSELEWISCFSLSNLDPLNFSFILIGLLLETPIVLISENLGLLSSTILTFLGLLSPFKWHFPIVPNLPQDLIQILDSPVPIFVAINKPKSEAKEMARNHKHILFVTIDNQELRMFNDEFLRDFAAGKIFTELMGLFKEMIERLLDQKAIFKGFNVSEPEKREVIPNPSKEQSEILNGFFNTIGTFLHERIIKLIPEKALYQVGDKNLLNYEMIRAQCKNKDRENRFLERFVETQMFTFFLDEFYLKS